MTNIARLLLSLLLVSSAFAAPASKPLSAPSKTIIVFFENKGAGQILNSPCAPYLNQLAREGASLKFYGFHHPSQPNYYEFFAGTTTLKQKGSTTTFRITNDSCPTQVSDSPTFGDRLGNDFLAYAEGYNPNDPTACPGDLGSPVNLYARRHCPWTTFPSLHERGRDFRSSWGPITKLPKVSLVIPNLYNDMHYASTTAPKPPSGCNINYTGPNPTDYNTNQQILQGDLWLKNALGTFVDWAKKNNGLLVITFDEDQGHGDTNGKRLQWPNNQIATILVGQLVEPGSTGDTHYNHHDLQKTILALHGKQPVGDAVHAKYITGIWKTEKKK